MGSVDDEAQVSVFPTNDTTADDSDEDEFLYPGVLEPESVEVLAGSAEHLVSEQFSSVPGTNEEEFVYPGASPTPPYDVPRPIGRTEGPPSPLFEGPSTLAASKPSSPPKAQPSPAQLESLFVAASTGDLEVLQTLVKDALNSRDLEPFALVNDVSPRTGLTALHAASSRGHLRVVRWLVEECGAIPNIEDREGETALHKAALHGHLPVITYLLPEKADVHAQDADGWTALHNASSKGYLDIVRWLCESGGAASVVNGTRGVDVRSKGGWTPLMNAASKGHLPVVLYLLNKQFADPLVRNNWGETAYDAAAAVFEVWICEILQKAECEKWHGTTIPYNPLAVHTTVPLVLYEHQRLDMRLKTLAISGGKPKFSASGLGRRGHQAPFELMLPQLDETGQKGVPAWRSDVQLPLREAPLTLPRPGKDQPSREGAERSHFWLSDWTLDVTHPGVDAELGWQYAHYFDDPDDQWAVEPPPQLERLLSGSGAVAAGFGGTASGSGSSSRTRSQNSRVGSMNPHWVRRRRWVRVMRRRLDIPPMPFLQPDGNMYHLGEDGVLLLCNNHHWSSLEEETEGQEMDAMPVTALSMSQDYVARARYLAGSPSEDIGESNGELSAVDARRAIAKLERATTELRQGILSDGDPDRKTQAEVLLNAYSRDLERRRMAASAQGLLIFGDADDYSDEEDSDDEEFRYPGSSPVDSRRHSLLSTTTDVNYPMSSRGPTDLTSHLSQSPEFRVPTHEAPQKILTPRWTPPTPHQLHAQWERDDAVTQCRECRRRFNFITRRHCRRCGRIFCDRCSSYRTLLDPSDVVVDPASPEISQRPTQHRVCRACYEEVTAVVPSGLQNTAHNTMERIVIDQGRLSVPSQGNGETNSQISDLAECPVCNSNLAEVGPPFAQEAHLRNCLEGGNGTSPQTAKYLVYKLPEESALIGVECVICLEEFVAGSTVARLSCLCSFHNACLFSWLQRGRSCPVHAR